GSNAQHVQFPRCRLSDLREDVLFQYRDSLPPYYRLQHRRTTFDQVATLSVEGLNKSAIARVERIGWNMVDRWLEKASDCGRRFNDQEITGFSATELQVDEI